MGGGSAPSSSGSGSGKSWAKSTPVTWETLLPPWTIEAQKEIVPELMERAREGGMSPEEERLLWGMARGEVLTSTQGARRQLASKMAASGISPRSPVWAGEQADIAAQIPVGTAQAIANLAKLKIGAGESARQQLLTALYTPPPYTTAYEAYSKQQSTQSQSGGGGGK